MQTFFLVSLGFLLFMTLTQSIHVFPGAFFSLFGSKKRNPKTIPPEVESIFITTPDHKSLEVWRLPANDSATVRGFIGIIFHGNGGSLETFFLAQLWFQELGITSYGFDYRGFGKSTGWPSEKGIEIDSDAFWKYVTEREGVSPKNIIVLGISVGSAPAARIAALHEPKMLVLSSAFTDLKQVIRDNIITRVFARFVFYKLPTIDFVAKLQATKLIIEYGMKDTIVKPYHSKKLASAYRGNTAAIELVCKDSGHNGVFYSLRKERSQAVINSLA